MTWFALQNVINKIEAIKSSVVALEKADDIRVYAGRKPVQYKADGKTAKIEIKGVLLKEEDLVLSFFGEQQTLYSEIIAEIESANKSKDISRIELLIDSGGGNLDGMFDAMAVIAQSEKPVTARVTGVCASAAYMLASQSKKIIAQHDWNMLGSFGVATTVSQDPLIKEISNTDSPKKRPDVSNDDGVAVVRETLDDIFNLVTEAVATGRNTTVETVKNNYGKGAVYTARTALQMGMIDSIGFVKPGPKQGVKLMEEFERGINAERDRVTAHLIRGEASGDLQTAIEAIKSGEQMTESVKAKYFAASVKKVAIEERQTEAVATVKTVVNTVSASDFDKQKTELKAKFPGLVLE